MKKIDFTPENSAKSLMQLALSVVEVVRHLMEKQVIRRMEDNTLSDEKIEEIGQTFHILEEKLAEIRDHFGLTPEDLQLKIPSISIDDLQQ